MASMAVQATLFWKKMDFMEKEAYQQQSRHEHVHLATGYTFLVEFLALTTLKSNGRHCYPMNGQKLLRGHHEVLEQFRKLSCNKAK